MEALYLFNPDNDMALACGDPYYMAPASARRMAAELSALPAWWAEEGASVLLDTARQAKVITEQFPLPLPVQWVTEISPLYNKVYPWGWSPSLVHRLQEAGVASSVCPSKEQMERIRQLSGRQTAVEILRRCHVTMNTAPVSPYIKSSGSYAGVLPLAGESFLFSSLKEVEAFVLSHPRAVLKSPWSGSGRGIQYTSGEFPLPLKGWVEHILTTQHQVAGEPLYDKIIDFAMEFFSDARKGCLRFIGYSLFNTDKRGSYKENLLAPDADIESRLAKYVSPEILHRVRETLLIELADVISGDYQGYLGVDMMVCRTTTERDQERYVLHPCVEINLRMNMGVVAHRIYEKYVSRGAHGRYVIEYYARPGEAEQAHLAFQQQYPLKLADERVESGYLSLTPVMQDTAYQAYIIIG